MEPEEGLYCGGGGWLGCRDIGAVGCRGLGGTQGCACGESKEWGVSQAPAEAASLAFPLLHNTLWGDLAHPHPTELNRDSSEIPSTLPPLWQVWGAKCGMQRRDMGSGCNVQDIGFRIRMQDSGSECGVQDGGFWIQCRIGTSGAGHLVQDQDMGAGSGCRAQDSAGQGVWDCDAGYRTWCRMQDVGLGCGVQDTGYGIGMQDAGHRTQDAECKISPQDVGSGYSWALTVLRTGRSLQQHRCPGACLRSAAPR